MTRFGQGVAQKLTDQLERDQRLVLGARVDVRWTTSERVYRAVGVIVAAHAKSVRVKLERAVGIYPEGYKVVVPRLVASRNWNTTNCALPLDNGAHVLRLEWPIAGYPFEDDAGRAWRTVTVPKRLSLTCGDCGARFRRGYVTDEPEVAACGCRVVLER